MVASLYNAFESTQSWGHWLLFDGCVRRVVRLINQLKDTRPAMLLPTSASSASPHHPSAFKHTEITTFSWPCIMLQEPTSIPLPPWDVGDPQWSRGAQGHHRGPHNREDGGLQVREGEGTGDRLCPRGSSRNTAPAHAPTEIHLRRLSL